MFNTPTDWLYTELGALSSIKTGKKDVNEGDPDGNYPFFTCSRTPSRSRSFSFDTEAILIAGNGEVGNVIYFKGKFEAYQRTYVLHDFKANTQYLTHFLRANLRARLESQHIGSVIPFIKLGDLNDFSIRLPANTVEQQKIVQILDTLDTQIQKTEVLIAKLEKIKEGLLHDLLTRGIDQNGQLRPTPEQAPELYKESALGLIPKEWLGTKLGTYISDHEGLIQTGPFGSQLHAEEYVSQGVPVVMPQDIRHISISRSNIAQITEKRARDLARHRLLEGDLVFSRRGDLSRCAYVKRDNEGWVCGTGCLLLRAPIGTIDTYWLSNLYKLQSIQSQVYGMAVGSTMVNLNSKILAQLEIGIPSYREQCLIATAISSMESRLQRETNSLRKLTAQKTGLMDDLLTGRVRVTPLLKDAV